MKLTDKLKKQIKDGFDKITPEELSCHSEMTTYEASIGLKYKQLLYLIKVTDCGYLIIGGQNPHTSDIGEIIKLNTHEVKESSFNIEHSPLNGTYLFDFFLENF